MTCWHVGVTLDFAQAACYDSSIQEDSYSMTLYQQLMDELLTVSQRIGELGKTNDVKRLQAAYITAIGLWARLNRLDWPQEAA